MEETRRLERARNQYENLLIQASDSLLDKSISTADGVNQPQYNFSPPTQSRGRGTDVASTSKRNNGSPPHYHTHRSADNTPAFDRLANIDADDNGHYFPSSLIQMGDEMKDNPIDNETSLIEKDNIIIALQEEVERLRSKLNSVVESAQGVVEEANVCQEELLGEYDRKILALSQRNHALEIENQSLKSTLEIAQAQVTAEEEQLLKSVRFIERMKRRGREYIEVQRKSHALLQAAAKITHHKGGRFPAASTTDHGTTAVVGML